MRRTNNTEKKTITDQTKMVLRYHLGFENTQKRFAILEDFLARTGIHRIILFSAPFVEQSSIIPVEYYRKHAQMLKPYIDRLKSDGIEVGINMLYTIGHCFYADENEMGLRRAVTIDGEKSNGCICMRDENIAGYIREIYQCYAELKPSVIFADDDIRATSLGQLTCFCPEHLRLISERVGESLTLEEIREHITNSGYRDDEIRDAYFKQVKDDVDRIFHIIADAVHDISPDTEIGIMTTSYPSVTADRDLKGFFEENLTKNKISRIRTGMDFYREGEITAIPMNFSHPAIQREFINNGEVEIQPEIENDTYGFYQKSNSITKLQMVWCLCSGFRNMQLNLFDFIDYPVENYEEITRMFETSSSYRNAITRLIPENHRADGISIYANPRALTKRKDGFIFQANWYSWLQLMGLPLGTDNRKSDFLFLTGDDVCLCTDDEIDSLLKKGAVLDLRAAEALVYRGYGKRIGIKKIEPMDEIFAGERLTEHIFNGIYNGSHNSHYFNSSLINSSCVAKITYDENVKLASHIINHRKENVAPGAASFENELGERFFILPSYDDGVFIFFTSMNPKRRMQLINAFEWIAKKSLAVYTDNERMCININCFEGRNVISMFNLSCDEAKNPVIHYNPIGTLKYLSENGRMIKLRYRIEEGKLVLQKTIKAFDTLIIEDKVECQYGND